jgi:NADH-quinone oxidoreductase subunit N
MKDLALLAPELILTAASLFLLVAETAWPGRRRLWVHASGAAVLVAAVFAARLMNAHEVAFGMMAVDGLAAFFKLVLLAGVLLVLWLSLDYREFRDLKSWGTYCAMLLLAAVGMLLLVSATDFILIVIAIELLGIASFVLTGYLRHQRRSSEAAIKFFLIGAFSSGLLLYGISLLYGVAGSTDLETLIRTAQQDPGGLAFRGGILFVVAGLGFKLAIAPFHMWVPDTYEGAPTPITAFLSVAPKAAAFAVLLRALPFHPLIGITPLLAFLSALTMTVGNLSALPQTNVKRLLGYSSVAQMGYILLGFVSSGRLGAESVLVYTLAYLFMNLGAFACVLAVTNEAQTDELDGFNGVAQRNFPLALITTIFLLSLTGIPPMLGFFGKFALFAAALAAENLVWLAVVGVINSVISLYYYFGIVRRMFFGAPVSLAKMPLAPAVAGSVAVTLLVTLGAGLFPNQILLWVRQVVP